MKTIFRTLCLAAVLSLCSSNLQAADYATFKSFYYQGMSPWAWTTASILCISGVALTIFSGGTAAPAGAAAISSGISSAVGASGAAGTCLGLALLGGNAGVKIWEISLLTAPARGMAYMEYMERDAYSKFAEANKEMITLPLPRNEKGGIAYRTAINYLKEHFKEDKPISDPENQHVLKRAREILFEKMQSEKDEEYILKDKTLLALLYLQTNQYALASDMARQATTLAHDLKETCTLPSFIWALSEIAMPEKDCTDEVIHALRVAYYHETDNKLIPIMTGCLMDRMMYRYRCNHLASDKLSYLCGIITHERIDDKLAAASLQIFVTRCLLELDWTREYFSRFSSGKLKDAVSESDMRGRLDRQRALISFLQREALPQLHRLRNELPKDSPITVEKMTSLLDFYYNDLPRMDAEITNGTLPNPPTKTTDNHHSALRYISAFAIAILFAGTIFYILSRRRQRSQV